MNFNLKSTFKPAGDQPKAIKELTASINANNRFQTLLGVTGSGKTFSIAKLIENINRPALVIAHNKTLAAQLVQEFREFFPDNAVEYFVSYYDYYQPEAYIPTSDTYIEKDASINEEIERMRSAATTSLMSRKDVIIVASVSCIYGLGNPENYSDYILHLEIKKPFDRRSLIEKLVDIGYERSEDSRTGTFRQRGNSIEISSPTEDILYRVEFDAKNIKKIEEYEAISHKLITKHPSLDIFPARHFMVSPKDLDYAIPKIMAEMKKRLRYFLKRKLYLEAERLERRVTQDMTLLREVGYVSGIENYSRYLTRRAPGTPPYTLLDYFPKNFLTVIDESHVTLPQLGGMYEGDHSRKKNLIKYGFRLPSALDNRPLKFDEFLKHVGQLVFTSATPGKFEAKNSKRIVEQIIRPTGLLDPKLEVKKSQNQIKDIISEIKKLSSKERILITALTKKMAEELADFLKENSIKACYLHSDVDTLDRVRILHELRQGKFQVLVGVNLLREGLDLPEVTLVAILDADREGFLRNETSLIQTIGRAARNVKGRVILYSEKTTQSMARAIKETNRRREIQLSYNQKHNITPATIKKKIKSIASGEYQITPKNLPKEFQKTREITDINQYVSEKEKEMKLAADNLEFEKAAIIRDEIAILKKISR